MHVVFYCIRAGARPLIRRQGLWLIYNLSKYQTFCVLLPFLSYVYNVQPRHCRIT